MKKRRKGVKIMKLTDHHTSLGDFIMERRFDSIIFEGVVMPMGEEADREGRREEEFDREPSSNLLLEWWGVEREEPVMHFSSRFMKESSLSSESSSSDDCGEE